MCIYDFFPYESPPIETSHNSLSEKGARRFTNHRLLKLLPLPFYRRVPPQVFSLFRETAGGDLSGKNQLIGLLKR